ncbi:class I SAM-dependent DNA methyltransferase [Mucisphaera calidilacus]|uniref:dTDP-3-amino-3,4, 6-trideoxy-alpha-D-glucopyranose n=1 Tax=Mucisphaera calidilacus TaxID=2527982 RepID=A0A518BTE3_9BACT|nr:class I SAM-dependent methyltransferase [Mucisphaera calidilacus]QDU70246.1 dTDP-3-amino-3,4,6-trideoxy-alpha-D-glucopyranose [Mucisphaera calidilacus]
MTPRLYQDLAHLWPCLSPPEDYTAEAQIIHDLLTEHFGDRRLNLLELGAGGGHTLYHLKHHHNCTASDLSPEMLAQCQALNPEVPTIVADMRSAQLNQTFDAILIHDAIDYLLSIDDINQTLRTAHDHLRPNGLLLVAPTETADTFEHASATDRHTTDTHDYALTSTLERPHTPHTFRLTLDITITDRATQAAEHITDHHTCGLFPRSAWLEQLHDAGFVATPRETQLTWTLFHAVRP